MMKDSEIIGCQTRRYSPGAYLRKVLSSGTRAKHPQNTLDKKPVVSPRLARIAGLAQKQGLNPFPLLVAQLVSLHHHAISNRESVEEQGFT